MCAESVVSFCLSQCVHLFTRQSRGQLLSAVFAPGTGRKQRKLTGEIRCLTNGIVCYEVHVVVGCRLIGYFFLKILKTDISKKLKFLFSTASARRTTREGLRRLVRRLAT